MAGFPPYLEKKGIFATTLKTLKKAGILQPTMNTLKKPRISSKNLVSLTLKTWKCVLMTIWGAPFHHLTLVTFICFAMWCTDTAYTLIID